MGATASGLLGLPTPFSNLGIAHPILHIDPLTELPARMYENLAQIERYVAEHCATEAGVSWCEAQLEDMHNHLAEFKRRSVNVIGPKKSLAGGTEEIVQLALDMRSYAIKKYQLLHDIWFTCDDFAILSAILIAFWLCVHFLLYGVLDSR